MSWWWLPLCLFSRSVFSFSGLHLEDKKCTSCFFDRLSCLIYKILPKKDDVKKEAQDSFLLLHLKLLPLFISLLLNQPREDERIHCSRSNWIPEEKTQPKQVWLQQEVPKPSCWTSTSMNSNAFGTQNGTWTVKVRWWSRQVIKNDISRRPRVRQTLVSHNYRPFIIILTTAFTDVTRFLSPLSQVDHRMILPLTLLKGQQRR